MKTTFSIPGQFSETACAFTVEGQEVKAIVTSPDGDAPAKGGIIFSHGWSGFRSGPAGILATFARRFAQQGYTSIRFDYRGRGESMGDGLNASLTTMADDLVAATAFFKKSYNIDKPVYCGLCSGGNVVVGTLKRLPEASHLLLLSVYPFSDGDAFGRDVHRTLHYLKLYWHKLLRPQTWARLFKGEVKLKNVFNVIFGHFLNKNANKKKEGATKDDTPKDATGKLPKAVKAAAVESRTQGKEPPKKHLANLKQSLPGIMVYGTADPDAEAAIKYYGSYIKEHKLPIAIKTIQNANHNFSSPEWLDEAFNLIHDNLTVH